VPVIELPESFLRMPRWWTEGADWLGGLTQAVERARDWVVWRTVDYWLWGLSAGLTEDPVRCARLVDAL
jgi:hypothetical protein